MFCSYTRTSYQVSVHRTIGPLGLISITRKEFPLPLGKAALFYCGTY